MMEPKFRSLEDFLASRPLTIDGVAYDGGGVPFPVKGSEIDATVLFADIANFSGRTQELSAPETLAFVNHFFTWITAQAVLGESGGIVDKYIGDEIMIVFAKDFGSDDPFGEAITVARRFGDQDVFSFRPHIGIASGPVIVGNVGTPVKYNCSVFGSAVAMAARCAAVPVSKLTLGASIVFPATEWIGREFGRFFPPRRIELPDGQVQESATSWKLHPTRAETLKNIGPAEVVCIENQSAQICTTSTADWARRNIAKIRSRNGE